MIFFVIEQRGVWDQRALFSFRLSATVSLHSMF